MSERPHQNSTPSSNSRHAISNVSGATSSSSYQTAPAPSLPPIQDSFARPATQRSDLNPTTRQLPPPPPGPSRTSSFSNLLNPTRADEDAGAQDRRRKAAEMNSPPAALAPLQPYKQRQSPGPGEAFAQPRRILTPKSPGLHRAASMGQLSGPTGTIDAQQSPFLGSPRLRQYTAEPGAAGIPPMPTRSYTAYPAPGTSDRRTSSSTMDHRPRSPSISPRTAYASRPGPVRSSPLITAHPTISSLHYSDQDQRQMSIPISSTSGPSVYQMMAVQTSAGTVHLPVDIQAASKVADEKRKRNAGASARFRARRKEKEKESSSTISKLEMQVKDLMEDVEFYRRERNYFIGVIMQIPSGDRHFPRPPSPRHRRVSIGMQPSISGSSDYMSGQEIPRSPGDSRNVRRRVSALPMAAPQPPPTASGPSNYSQQYEPQQYQQQPQQPQSMHAPLPGPASLLQHQPAPSQPPPPGWNAYNDARPGNRPER